MRAASRWTCSAPGVTGVNRVLKGGTNCNRKRWNETVREEWYRAWIGRIGAGIAQFIKSLSNPLKSAWEARTLPLSYARSLKFSAELPVKHAVIATGVISVSACTSSTCGRSMKLLIQEHRLGVQPPLSRTDSCVRDPAGVYSHRRAPRILDVKGWLSWLPSGNGSLVH